jgi:hypothetical protein
VTFSGDFQADSGSLAILDERTLIVTGRVHGDLSNLGIAQFAVSRLIPVTISML